MLLLPPRVLPGPVGAVSHVERLSCQVFSVLLCLVASGFAGTLDVPPKKRIAVLNFDSPTLGVGARSGLLGANSENVGKGVSAQLIQKLIQGGRYTVIDRSALEKLLKEQPDREDDRVDPYRMATRIGQLLGLDAMVIGAITRYGPDDAHTTAGQGLSPSGVHTRKSKAFVEISAQVLNMSTGETIAAFRGAGESSRSALITTVRGHGHSTTSSEILSSDFVETLFPEATRNAIDELATQLNAFADRIPALHISVEGLVAAVDGDVLTVNVGVRSGIRLGDQLQLYRYHLGSSDLRNEDASLSAREPVGFALVTEVGRDFAMATFSGAVRAQVGDRVQVIHDSGPLAH